MIMTPDMYWQIPRIFLAIKVFTNFCRVVCSSFGRNPLSFFAVWRGSEITLLLYGDMLLRLLKIFSDAVKQLPIFTSFHFIAILG